MLPVVLNVRGVRVVVVGAGPVGRRKARSALDAGAAVRVVALEARPPGEFAEAEWLAEPFAPGHLADARLVFAAANESVNAAVVEAATARGVWVCDAADPARGDLHTPASFRRGPVTIAVSTDGTSPALARSTRDHLAAHLGAAFAEWAALQGEFRHALATSPLSPAERRRLLTEFADFRWLEVLRAEGADAVRGAMRRAADAASGFTGPRPPDRSGPP